MMDIDDTYHRFKTIGIQLAKPKYLYTNYVIDVPSRMTLKELEHFMRDLDSNLYYEYLKEVITLGIRPELIT